MAGWQSGRQAGSEGGEISVGSSAKVTSSQQAAAVSRADCRAAHSHLRLHPALPCSALRPPRPHSHSQSVSNSILSESQSVECRVSTVESSRESRSRTRDSTLEQSLSLFATRLSILDGEWRRIQRQPAFSSSSYIRRFITSLASHFFKTFESSPFQIRSFLR